MSFPRYPKYKVSGADWLGDLPEHWSIVPLRHVADCLDGLRVPLNAEQRAACPGAVPYWGANCVVDHVERALISEPVVLLGEDGAPFFDKAKDIAFYIDEPIWPNNHVHVLRPRCIVEGRYLAAALNITDYSRFIDGSTRDKLTQTAMSAIPIPMPTLPEQRAIAAFLDRETAKIDGLVAEQQRLIELLKERRQAVISHAVTKGLDPKAPMKPTGVEWLGDVPAHWAIVPMRYCVTRTASGGTPESGRGEFWDCDGTEESTAWVAIGDMTAAQVVTSTERRVTPSGIASKRLEIFPTGTILYSMYASLGKIARLGVPAAINQAILAIEPNAMMLGGEYLCYWLNHLEPALASLASSSTQSNLNAAKVRSLPVAVSPLSEQRAIAAFLDGETATIDGFVAEAESAITLLQERRAALISAAVTGQIDVRNAVAAEAA